MATSPSKPKPLSTCLCGSTDFDEKNVQVTMTIEPKFSSSTAPRPFWMRSCDQCGLVTLWNRKANRSVVTVE